MILTEDLKPGGIPCPHILGTEFPLIYPGKWKWERQDYRLGHRCWQGAAEQDSTQDFANLLPKNDQGVTFLTSASQMFSLALIYFSNLYFSEPPWDGSHFYQPIYKESTPKNAGEGEAYIQWKQTFLKTEAQDLFCQQYFPFLSHLSHSEPHSKINGSLGSEKAAVPCAPSTKCISAGAGVPKRPRSSKAGSHSLQERAVKYGLTCPGKGKCTMNCSSSTCSVNPNTDLGSTNTDKFNRRSREWCFTCHKLWKLNWVTTS